MEICFFPVPNIEEVSFGTAINKAFGTEVAKDLGMGEYKPGSTIRTYLVQYSNIYWAKKVRGLCSCVCVRVCSYACRLYVVCNHTTVDRGIAYCTVYRTAGVLDWRTDSTG